MERAGRMLVLLFAAGVAAPAAADIFPIRTPSGNIGCSVGLEAGPTGDIICEIVERQGPPAAPRPADCAGPWGHVFVLLERGPVEMQCGAPGTPSGDVAAYGQTGRFGAITCQSSEAGFQCSNADGHGFFLSRRRQSVF